MARRSGGRPGAGGCKRLFRLWEYRFPGSPTDGTDGVKTIAQGDFGDLLDWFETTRRDLPWRGTRDPYRVWVSEAMLQQTRAEVVRSRYERFLSVFPSLRALAEADVDDVVAAWSGLGYYARARNLHAAARIILHRHGGLFPRDLPSVRALPGIGSYMSHAILSIAYGLPLAVVDGNVIRVLSRVAMIPSRSPRDIQPVADRLLDPKRPGDSNQALMDLGARICTPRSPLCGECPVRSGCGARRTGRIEDFPPRRRRPTLSTIPRTIWVARDRAGRFWLERPTRPPLRGMWTFPWREIIRDRAARRIGTLDHAIMNRRYSCDIVLAGDEPSRIPGIATGPGRWIAPEEIVRVPHSSLVTKTLRILGEMA